MNSPLVTPIDAMASPGRLRMEVPHWTAQLTVCDSLGQVIRRADQLLIQAEEAPGSEPVWLATADLVPGIYEVELLLDEQVTRQLAIVRASETCRLTRQSWNRTLRQLLSSMPLVNTVNTPVAHSRAAERWSRTLTWKKSVGNSRLFLFVRRYESEKNARFVNNLHLLDANEKLITDFSEGVMVDEQAGWLAFTANLPAGFYLLKRERYDQHRVKYQPLYLSENWETHAFLRANKRPSLETLSLSMAPLDSGFRADDEAAGAAVALFNSLKRSNNPGQLVLADAVTRFLGNRTDNPWLSILLAYIIQLQEESISVVSSAVWPSLRDSWPGLLNRLDGLRTHPDVQALNLNLSESPVTPITEPPLVFAGLRRVQQHALRFADTIPVDSLLKRILPRVSTSSAWTAWRQTQPPAQPPTRKNEPMPLLDAAADPTDTSTNVPAVHASTPNYLRFVTPKLPVYQVQASADFGSDAGYSAGALQAGQSVSGMVLTIQALQATQSLFHDNLKTLPTTTPMASKTSIAGLLSAEQARPISQVSGVPLAQVQQSLHKLRLACEQPAKPENNLTAYDRTVFSYAVQQVVEGMTDDPLLTTIEEFVNKLLTESARLSALFTSDPMPPAMTSLVVRINALIDQLLLSARFVVVTDVSGKVLLSNGVFVILLKTSPPNNPASLSEWESFFKMAPFGSGTVPRHYVNKGSADWSLQRTVLHDDAHDQVMFLNSFQNPDGLLLTPELLGQLENVMPVFVLSTAAIAYNDWSEKAARWADEPGQQYQKLDTTLTQMEQILVTKR